MEEGTGWRNGMEERLSCVRCRQMLPVFLMTEADRLTAGVMRYPEVAAHLCACPDCAAWASRAWEPWVIGRRMVGHPLLVAGMVAGMVVRAWPLGSRDGIATWWLLPRDRRPPRT